jgi:2-phosphosulfolactate phosphatase
MQAHSDTRALCEWGSSGVAALRDQVAALVIVDVLSFSTAVDIAVARGAAILPCAPGDDATAAKAAAASAILADRRGAPGGRFSLSPASLQAIAPGTRLMLPSPNGSRLSFGGGATPVLAGCLRNAGAVAGAARAAAGSGDIGVIPAGERWPDGSLRPAIEDLIGAGAILDALGLALSPEARVARDAFRAARADLAALIRGSVSGRELTERGFAEDVALAVELEVSAAAPLLRDGAYRAAL